MPIVEGLNEAQPAPQPKDSVDFAAYMKSAHNMDFAGMSTNNLPIYRDQTGVESEVDARSLAQAQGIDLNTHKIDYNTANTPLNQSPDSITVAERIGIAAGNERGITEHLKSLGLEEPQYNANLGRFVAKEGGIWKAITPSGLGEGSAWDKTKEAAKSVADQTFQISNAAAQIGVAAIATGAGAAGTPALGLGVEAGLSGLVGAGNEALKISFGRAMGTYESEPGDIAKDIGTEMALNAGGAAVIGAGVRVSAPLVSKMISGTYDAFKGAPDASKTIWTKAMGMLGVEQKSLKTLLEHGPELSQTIRDAGERFGRFDGEKIVSGLTNDQVGVIKDAALDGSKATSALYHKMSGDVISSVPDSFKASTNHVTDPIEKAMVDLNIAKYVDNDGKIISSDELAYRVENNQPFYNGRNFKMLSQPEMFAKAHDLPAGGTGQELGQQLPTYLASKPDGQSIINSISAAVDGIKGSGEGSGKAAAARLLNNAKTLKDVLFTASQEAKEAGLGPVQAAVGQMQGAVRNNVANLLHQSAPEAAQSYAKMLETYHNMKTDFAPFELAAKRAVKNGSDLPYQSLLNQLSSKAGKNEVQKTAMESLVDSLAPHANQSPPIQEWVNKFQGYQKNLDILNAAKDFAPLSKSGLRVGAGAYAGMKAGAAAAGPGGAAAGAALGVLSQSPRAVYQATKGAAAIGRGVAAVGGAVDKMLPKGEALASGTGAADAATGALFSAKKFMENLNSSQRKALIENPAALTAFINSVAAVPYVHQGSKELLHQQFQQQQGQEQ